MDAIFEAIRREVGFTVMDSRLLRVFHPNTLVSISHLAGLYGKQGH